MIKKIFENLLYNPITKKVADYYRNTLQIDFQKNHLLEEIYKNTSIETYEAFKSEISSSLLFLTRRKIREYSISKVLEKCDSENLFIECGVFEGESINLFAKELKKKNFLIHGFDSFEGFDDNWKGSPLEKNFFNKNGKFPKVLSNVKLYKGRVQDTFKTFIENNNNKIKFLHLDMDLYEPTDYVLKNVKKNLDKNSFILMDDFANYPGWKNGPFKALEDNIPKNSYTIEGFGVFRSTSVLIKISKSLDN
jgi:hypothetical protein